MADTPTIPPDPIRTQSFSVPIAVSTALLLAATGWAIFDEAVVKRPYLDYQDKWVSSFKEFLDTRFEPAEGREATIKKSPEYVALKAELDRISAVQAQAIAEASNELATLTPYFDAVGFTFRDKKGRIDEFINRIESASGADKDDLRKELEAFKAKPFKLEIPTVEAGADGAKFAVKEYTAASLIDEFLAKKEQQGLFQGRLGRASAPVQAAKKAAGDYFAKEMRGLSAVQIDGLHRDLGKFVKEIKQIHVREIDLVDRCESCHLGINQPIDISASEIKEKAFVSHPNRALIAAHDVEKFGCSLCHGGNGVAVTSVDKAHGNYKHWLWPMHDKENVDAGCVSCHTKDLVVEHGPTVNRGKELFRWRGCWGCHKYEGFDTEQEQLTGLRKELSDLAAESDRLRTAAAEIEPRKAAVRERAKAKAKRFGDEITEDQDNAIKSEQTAAIAALGAESNGTAQSLAAVETARQSKLKRRSELYQEMKKVGPNLKEIKHKLRPEWLPTWIRNPEQFRPETKMPSFAYLTDDQLKSISAFLWTRALDPKIVPLAKNEKGDAAIGKRLFEVRGCTACHAVGEGDAQIGNDFAANLSRMGEKANFDYIVHWVQHPRNRLAPYSPDQKRDLVPADYTAKGLPYQWDLENAKDPSTGGDLVAHNFTVMPSLRLSDSDARDIATYLLTMKTDKEYEPVDWMSNATPELLKKGEFWTKHFGCTGCHEISGLEDEQRIGVELTVEGSKPMERLDFGLLTHDAKHPPHPKSEEEHARLRAEHPYPPADPEAPLPKWYEHKGFFMNKLKNPQIYDTGKERAVEDPAALKMPNFRLSESDRVAVTTYLLGSVETNPRLKEAGYFHQPTDGGKAIQEGWWVIKKYNCQGCHQINPGEEPPIWSQGWFDKAGMAAQPFTLPSGEVLKGGPERRPPSIVGQGFRTNPVWLAEFLRNPALSKTSLHRNGVRSYMNARMPSFHLSENEIQKLVAFFGALAGQPAIHVQPDVKPLDTDELATARELFNAASSNCIKCHARDEKFDPAVIAPSFALTPARLNPKWVSRWIQTPQSFAPGSQMPALFKQENGRWILSTEPPPRLKAYKGDHIELLERFLYRYNEYEKN